MPSHPHDLICWRPIAAPMGTVALGLRRCGSIWTDWPDLLDHDWPHEALRDDACCSVAADVLERFFAGDAIDPAAATCPTPDGPPFHRTAWAACRRIPLGTTATYAQLARNAGHPAAVRAAGGAMRANPLPVFIPCHRIIASDGGLGGFAGTQDPTSKAVQLKYDLLDFESAHVGNQTSDAIVMAST